MNLVMKYFSVFTIFVTTSGFFIHNYFLSRNYGIVDFNVLNSRMIYSGLSYTFILFASIIGSMIFTDVNNSNNTSKPKLLLQWLIRGLVVSNTFALFMDLQFDDKHARIAFNFLSIFITFFWLNKFVLFADGDTIRVSWIKFINKFEIIFYEMPIIALSLWLLQNKDYRQACMFFVWVVGFYYAHKMAHKTNNLSSGTEQNLKVRHPSYFTDNPNKYENSKRLHSLTMVVCGFFVLIPSVCLYTNFIYPNLPQRYGGASTEKLFITLRNGDEYLGEIINESEGLYYMKVADKICFIKVDEIKELSRCAK